MSFIEGGVCAPKGFQASGVKCGIRPNPVKNDLAVVASDEACTCAGVFTKNVVKAAPVLLDMETVKMGKARAIIANSGIANACAEDCEVNAQKMQQLGAGALGLSCDEVLVCSTGIIGQRLNIEAIEEGLPGAVEKLSHSPEGSASAAEAIMTTDTVRKEQATEVLIGGVPVRIGAIVKGSGMIHPNMGTMLCFATTDCAISREMLDSALRKACNISFNRISVDGDMSTNDTFLILANGMAGNPVITAEGEDFDRFVAALQSVSCDLARRMAADGEGAKHLITCTVTGAASEADAETLAKSVISSSLTKAAIFGNDANWGRVLAAMGYSGVQFDPDGVDISCRSVGGEILVCQKGHGLEFDEELAARILTQDEVEILCEMTEGDGEATCWGCDLTYDYVKINGDYRS